MAIFSSSDRADSRPAGGWLAASMPVLSVLFFVLINLVPWPYAWLRTVLAPLVVVALCYWIIHRPQLFGMRWSFAIGLLQDLLSGQMPGVQAFSYMVADYVLRGNRHLFVRGTFIVTWVAFAVAICATLALQGAIARFFMDQPVDIEALLARAGLGVLLYPLMARLLHSLETSPARRRRA